MSEILRITFVGLITAIIILFLALIGVFNLGDDCWYRYDTDTKEQDTITRSVTILASGQYEYSTNNSSVIDVSKQYGNWIRSDFYVSEPGQSSNSTKIKVLVDGSVSLCHAYLPKNALMCKLQASDLSGNECNIADVNSFINGKADSCIEACEDNKDEDGSLIRVPRVEEMANGIPIILRANVNQWRNIAKVNTGDVIEVRIGRNLLENGNRANIDYIYSPLKDNQHSNQAYDSGKLGLTYIFNRSKVISADCTPAPEKKLYSPICGVYTPWNDEHYIEGCKNTKEASCSECEGKCTDQKIICPPLCAPVEETDGEFRTSARCLSKSKWRRLDFISPNCGDGELRGKCPEPEISKSTLPHPYKSDGSTVVPDMINISDSEKRTEIENDLRSLGNIDCTNDHQKSLTEQRKNIYSWRSANYATDLKYRFSDINDNGNIPLGNKCTSDKKDNDNEFNQGKCYHDAIPSSGRDIYSDETLLLYKLSDANNLLDTAKNNLSDIQTPKYLQYRISPPKLFPDNDISKKYGAEHSSGGYVLYLKHTACVRKAGVAFSDDRYPNRGKILYVVAPSQVNVNELNNDEREKYPHGALDVKVEDRIGIAEIDSEKPGYIWFKVDNHPDDYKESLGKYVVKTTVTVPRGNFLTKILNPIITMIKQKIGSIGKQMFQRMTCYDMTDKSTCVNFFLYIRLMLTLYIIVCAFRFMVGDRRMTVRALVIAFIKVIIIGGLINGSTFRFFSGFLYDFIMNISAQLMVNVSGYEYKKETDIFMFLDQLLTKIFFNKIFLVQILTVLSFGLAGLFYYVLLFVPIILIVMSLLQTIMVYLVSMVSIAILIGLAPIFLSFILFERTKYLFDNWCSFLIRYILEPVILMAGITVLTQLFVVYLDFVLNYSVCWKCAVYFKIPASIFQSVGIPLNLSDIPIFCIKWFGAWGYDNIGIQDIGLAMNHVVALIIIAYCINGYVDFAKSLVRSLTIGAGSNAPDAISIGQNSWDLIYNNSYTAASSMVQTGASNLLGGINTVRDVIRRQGISKSTTENLTASGISNEGGVQNVSQSDNISNSISSNNASGANNTTPITGSKSDNGITNNNVGSHGSIQEQNNIRNSDNTQSNVNNREGNSSTDPGNLRTITEDIEKNIREDGGFRSRDGIREQRINQDETTAATSTTETPDIRGNAEEKQTRDDTNTDAGRSSGDLGVNNDQEYRGGTSEHRAHPDETRHTDNAVGTRDNDRSLDDNQQPGDHRVNNDQEYRGGTSEQRAHPNETRHTDNAVDTRDNDRSLDDNQQPSDRDKSSTSESYNSNNSSRNNSKSNNTRDNIRQKYSNDGHESKEQEYISRGGVSDPREAQDGNKQTHDGSSSTSRSNNPKIKR